MNKQSFEEYLENNDRLVYRNTGTSMLPLLKQGRDFFIVEKVNNRPLRKYDVVLYKRQPDSYVLHRIIKIENGKYVIMGDNCINKEYGITDNDIIAVMTGFIRKGRQHSTSEFFYKLYSVCHCALSPLRILLFRIRSRL
ncbi:S26 family signal peptidase [uncultured Ruminococcus sp.]|uniref:S26 family signal peptidase n=1 Tax=uncultured Ruminococcus sp. TaxID=165186 RepID=UPI0025E44081|nr:S26 family signal peptidase [uncultured Ruminococcus sp.]